MSETERDRGAPRLQPEQGPIRDQRNVAEGEHEGEQEERQRDHPKERHGGDVVWMWAVTATSRPEGTIERATHAAAPPRPCGRGASRTTGRRPRGACRAHNDDAADADGGGEAHEACAPPDTLRVERKGRLEDEGIGDQRGEGAEVGGGVQQVGIARVRAAASSVPRLKQRPVGRQGEEGKADGRKEEPDEPESLAVSGRTPPTCGKPR